MLASTMWLGQALGADALPWRLELTRSCRLAESLCCPSDLLDGVGASDDSTDEQAELNSPEDAEESPSDPEEQLTAKRRPGRAGKAAEGQFPTEDR